MGLFGDVGSPEEIDRTVRLRLAHSLEHIFTRTGEYLDIDHDRFWTGVDQIRASRQDPGVFARYYDLVFAVTSGNLDTATRLFEEVIKRTSEPAAFAILPYERETLGSDYERFPRLLFAEYSQANPMASPLEAQSQGSTQAMREAVQVISLVDPTIHTEIQGLLSRIYLAVGSKEPSAKAFGGVTSFLVWGATFANIESYRTRWDTVQFLVHEITHALLLGLACDDPLVLNSPEESYKSPLRSSLRPMDGIFHASLVCARLADFNRAWLDSGLLAGQERAQSERAAPRNLEAFREGLFVITEHGKLSDQARELIDRSCRGLGIAA